MREKNGFVFIETIVVCAVLSVSLVVIYAAFVLLVNDQKKRNRYDQIIYNYRLYTVAKELQAKGNVLDSCNSSNPLVDETNETEVEKNLNIVKLYYVNSNMLDNLPSQMSDLADYVKTININGDTCLLIGKFKRKVNDKDEYYFSHLTIQKG